MALTTRARFGQLIPSEFTVSTTGNIDDLDFGDAQTIRFTNASLSTLRGLKAGTAGQEVTILSVGAGEVDLAHQNAGSSAANRLINPVTSASLPLSPGSGVTTYRYDGTTARWRQVLYSQGAWIAVPFAAGNFTVTSGGGTWPVSSGMQSFFSFHIEGTTMLIDVVLNATTITGTVTQIGVAIPNSFTCPGQAWGTCNLYDNSSSVFVAAAAFAVSAKLLVQKGDGTNFAASSANTYLRILTSIPIT